MKLKHHFLQNNILSLLTCLASMPIIFEIDIFSKALEVDILLLSWHVIWNCCLKCSYDNI